MTKIIKQIGVEGRTTIPLYMREVLDIQDGDFISFEVDPSGKSIRVMREQICPHRVVIHTAPQRQKHTTDTKKLTEKEKILVTGFFPDFDEKTIQKALFALENILGLGGDSK